MGEEKKNHVAKDQFQRGFGCCFCYCGRIETIFFFFWTKRVHSLPHKTSYLGSHRSPLTGELEAENRSQNPFWDCFFTKLGKLACWYQVLPCQTHSQLLCVHLSVITKLQMRKQGGPEGKTKATLTEDPLYPIV